MRFEQNDNSITPVVRELKTEFTQFIDTRLRILKAEVTEKIAELKVAAIGGAIGVALASVGFLGLTFAAIAGIAAAFAPNPFAWCFAALIVGFGYVALGGIALVLVKNHLQEETLIPERTLKVLKQDQIWLEQELARKKDQHYEPSRQLRRSS